MKEEKAIHPSSKYAKIYAKVEDYNTSARKYGFAEIKFDQKNGLISSFLPNDAPSKGFWYNVKYVLIYIYMSRKWDIVQSTKNKIYWGL